MRWTGDVGCPVFIGSRTAYMVCDLPAGHDRDDRKVCTFHSFSGWDLPYTKDQLMGSLGLTRKTHYTGRNKGHYVSRNRPPRRPSPRVGGRAWEQDGADG